MRTSFVQPFSPLRRPGADSSIKEVFEWNSKEAVETIVRKLLATGFNPAAIVALLNSRETSAETRPFACVSQGFKVIVGYLGNGFMSCDTAPFNRPIERVGEADEPLDLIHALMMQGFDVRAVTRLLNSREKAVPPVYNGYMLGLVTIVECRGKRLYVNMVEMGLEEGESTPAN